jgi:pyrroline-5-carboxylate reductase
MGLKGKFVLVGAGAMGSALLHAWIRGGLLSARQVAVVDLDRAKLSRLARELKVGVTGDPASALKGASTVLLAVKPQQMRELLDRLGRDFPPKALVVSIAAGVSTAQIEKRLPNGNPVVRVMPNTPSQLGCGMAGVAAGSRSTAAQAKTILKLFGSAGLSVLVPESHLDLLTAISGSGPAYFFRMIEVLAEAGVEGGLTPKTAKTLAAQTALGAARMVLETGKEPGELRAQVTSPGGTTQAGLAALEAKGFTEAVKACVRAAEARGAELRKMSE